VAEDRRYVEVEGKRIPLKTEAERAASRAAKSSRPDLADSPSPASGNGGRRVSVDTGTVVRTPAARQVVLAMTVSALIYAAAVGLDFVADERGTRPTNPLPKFGGFEALFAWGTVFVFLIAMADFGEAPGQLATAFAYLFLIAILFTYGIEAFSNIRELYGDTGGEPPASAPGSIGGGVRPV
jgi:hypothetical protein